MALFHTEPLGTILDFHITKPKIHIQDFLAEQWLRLCTSAAEVRVPPLLGELRSCISCGMAKKQKFFLTHRQHFRTLFLNYTCISLTCFPGGSDSKESACNARDLGSIPGLGRSPGGGHGNPLQDSCLENSHRQRSLASYSPQRVGHNWTTKHSKAWLNDTLHYQRTKGERLNHH